LEQAVLQVANLAHLHLSVLSLQALLHQVALSARTLQSQEIFLVVVLAVRLAGMLQQATMFKVTVVVLQHQTITVEVVAVLLLLVRMVRELLVEQAVQGLMSAHLLVVQAFSKEAVEAVVVLQLVELAVAVLAVQAVAVLVLVLLLQQILEAVVVVVVLVMLVVQAGLESSMLDLEQHKW
jgi:hypothetical protein